MVVTGTYLRRAVEQSGASFRSLLGAADINFSRPEEILPDRMRLPPGPALFQYIRKRAFLDPMPDPAASLRAAIIEERPDAVITDSHFAGRIALFLDRSRPPVPLIACGVSFLPLDRPDGASPNWGMPPVRDATELARYAKLAAENETYLEGPTRAYADSKLAELGLPRLPFSYTASFGQLADAYLHPTVPSFEDDYGTLPQHVRFVGSLPPPLSGHPLPEWWDELSGTRQIVLITQGTVSNADFGELVEPTLEALAHREDLLLVVTTGDRSIDDLRLSIPKNARLAEFVDTNC